jgi:hypothetical protein
MDDDDVMSLLRASLGDELTVSARAVEAARAAFDWVAFEQQMADVVFDSADEPALEAGVRSVTAAARQVTYRAGELTVDCELGPDGLVGEVLPAGTARVWLRSPSTGDRELAVDERGRFADPHPPPGPFALRIMRAGQLEVVTAWLLP